MNVYEKLNQARENLLNTKMKKSGKNKFAGYNYFELQDFLDPITKIFKEIGLCSIVSFDETMATMTIVNTEAPEEKVVFTSPMGKAQLKGCHEIQNIGACETYNRRYLYLTALEIVEHDAVDSSNPQETKKETKDETGELITKYITSFKKEKTVECLDTWSDKMTPHINKLDKDTQDVVWSKYNEYRSSLG